MMLSKRAFEDSMMNLMAYYNGFEFPLKPKTLMETTKYNVWYEVFKDLSDDDMHKVVKSYCTANIYAPSSPTPLIDKIRELRLMCIESAEQAWEIVEKNLYKGVKGYQGLDDSGNVVHLNPFMDTMKKYPMIMKACTEIMSSLATVTSDNKSYVRNEFKQVYGRHIDSVVQIGSSQLKLGG